MNKNKIWNLLHSIYDFSININQVLNFINPNIIHFILKQKVYTINLECFSYGKIKIVPGKLYINLNIAIIDSEIRFLYLNMNEVSSDAFILHFEKYFILKNNNIHVNNLSVLEKFKLFLETDNKQYFNIDNNNFITKENLHSVPEIIMNITQ